MLNRVRVKQGAIDLLARCVNAAAYLRGLRGHGHLSSIELCTKLHKLYPLLLAVPGVMIFAMPALLRDTHLEAEGALIRLLLESPPGRKLEMVGQ